MIRAVLSVQVRITRNYKKIPKLLLPNFEHLIKPFKCKPVTRFIKVYCYT